MVHTHDAPPGSAPFENLFIRNHLLPCCLCISSLQALLFDSCCLIVLYIIFFFFLVKMTLGVLRVQHTPLRHASWLNMSYQVLF